MRRELPYFTIDGGVGGNQDWFTNVVMYMGGCAAATACDCCICFALHRGMEELYPYDIQNLTREDYKKFSQIMKPYLRPRVGGVKKLSMYTEGFTKYLREHGETHIRMEGFSGEHTAKEAQRFVKAQIDAGMPIPYLMLKHNDPAFKDFVWHWFLCYGYEETESTFKIIVATYGESTELDLDALWNTGYEEKGGMIRLELTDESL